MPLSSFARLGRLALLLAPVLMAGALFFTVWSTYRGVTTASELLVRGQADLVHDGVRAELGGLRQLPTDAELAAALEALSPEGLTYVAALDGEGRLLAQAGEPVSSPVDLRAAAKGARGPDLVPIDKGRVRSFHRGPSRRRNPGAAPRAMLVLELAPTMAQRLQANARETLAVGALTATALLIMALVLVRWLLRREAGERRLEHQRRLAAVGRMSAVLAHEIRNPLASLKGNAQLLARALPENEKPRAKADRVVSEAVRLEKLVNDLLEFARGGGLHRVEADPALLAREVAVAHGPRVEVDATGAPARASMDPDRVRQVLNNLVENALQASEGVVTLGVTTQDHELRFTVRDHGSGIAEEDLERIFEPFFTRRTQGTGLGLAVARRVVELHGGTLVAANHPEGGALFTFDLPRLR